MPSSEASFGCGLPAMSEFAPLPHLFAGSKRNTGGFETFVKGLVPFLLETRLSRVLGVVVSGFMEG